MHEKFTKIVDFLRDSALDLVFGVVFMLIRSLRGRLRESIFTPQRVALQTLTVKEDQMEKVIPVSKEVSVNIAIANGKIKISVEADTDMLLDELAAKIPGSIDDAIITVVKAALKQV